MQFLIKIYSWKIFASSKNVYFQNVINLIKLNLKLNFQPLKRYYKDSVKFCKYYDLFNIYEFILF